MKNFIGNTPSWKVALSQLKDLRKTYMVNEPDYTYVERKTNWEEIQQRTEAVTSMILTGALNEYNGAISRYQTAASKLGQAQAAEALRWDAAKLSAERQNIRQQIDLALEAGNNPFGGVNPVDKIASILGEAQRSGDLSRVRAAAEVGRAIVQKAPAISYLVSDLESNVNATRITPEMEAANKERSEALKNLIQVRGGLPEIAEATGWGNPEKDVFNSSAISKAMHKVKLSPDQTTAEILADDDPEVCGFTILPEIGDAIEG